MVWKRGDGVEATGEMGDLAIHGKGLAHSQMGDRRWEMGTVREREGEGGRR